MYSFEYLGGSQNITNHETEKFLLFVIVDGREVPFYHLTKVGVIQRGENVLPASQQGDVGYALYNSPFPDMKLFMYHSGFGVRKQFYSFYIRLLEPPAPIVKIKPIVPESNYRLRGCFQFLNKEEVLKVLHPSDKSYFFVKNAEPIPLRFIKDHTEVDRSLMRVGIRRVRF